MTDILLITTTDNPDIDALALAAADARPDAVTILLDPGPPAERWGWADSPRERDLRDQMAVLLAHVERATGAAVAGVVGDESIVAGMEFDAVVRPRVLAAA
jgi:hypothetical protein